MAAVEYLTAYFGDWDKADEEIAEELDCLAGSLLRNADQTLDRLFDHYHVEPAGLLHILRENRLRWRFDNVSRMFQAGTVEELESWPDSMDRAAEQLAFAKPLLVHEWCDSMEALFSDGREVRLTTSGDESAFVVNTALPPGMEPDTPLALSESLERVEVGHLAMRGRASVDESGYLDLAFPDQIEQAIAVLRKAAMTLRRRDLRAAVDAETGKPIFGPGPRRKFVHETTCARELVAFLKAETGKPLYDHAGMLLRATFPESCGYWSEGGEKRLRDRVKQLLKRGASN